MKKSIGEVIKELRKEKNITQEKLAEYLGISFQAVSRWENGLAYPDVTLVPQLARFFEVSTDFLFDMENTWQEEEKEKYKKEYVNLCKEGKLEERFTRMRQALKEFPREYLFMISLAETMELYGEGTSKQKEIYAKNNFSKEIESLCLRIKEDCTDDSIRQRTIPLLCKQYVLHGKNEQALQLANTMTSVKYAKEILLAEILSGEEKQKQLQQNMLGAIDYVATTLVNMAFRKEYGFSSSLTLEEKVSYVMAANQLYQILISDGNYQFYHRIICWNHRRLAELYCALRQNKKAVEELILAEKEAIKYDNLTEFAYTAPFVNQLIYVPEEHEKSWVGSEQGMLLYRCKELSCYLEEMSEFKELVTRLEMVTKQKKEIEIE